jgi:hypothetical protein
MIVEQSRGVSRVHRTDARMERAMVQFLLYALMVASIVAGIGIGTAAVINAWGHYKISMRALELGVALPARERFSLVTISLKGAGAVKALLEDKR